LLLEILLCDFQTRLLLGSEYDVMFSLFQSQLSIDNLLLFRFEILLQVGQFIIERD
jgi:hypothetical protein